VAVFFEEHTMDSGNRSRPCAGLWLTGWVGPSSFALSALGTFLRGRYEIGDGVPPGDICVPAFARPRRV
jgi:hypothetical protein